MAVLEWIAVGLRTDEINDRAASFDPPFSVSRQQVDFYRKTRQRDINAILSVDENNALTTGLSLKEVRVTKLQQLASLMEQDLFGGFLWTEQVKGVGSGMMSTIVDYEEFNKAEVESYRGVLDDIAREVGHRAIRQEHTGADGDVIRVKVTNDD